MNTAPVRYVTTAMVRGDHAHGLQIMAMADAFHQVLGSRFRLVSPTPLCITESRTYWEQIPCRFRRRSWRYPEVALRSLRRVPRTSAIFTRDIGVAAAFSARGADVLYEMHTDFRTTAGHLAMKLLRHRIRFVAISGALKSHMIDMYGISSDRIFVAHDGYAEERYARLRQADRARLRAELGLPLNRTIIVHTGSLYEGRGVELLRPVLHRFPELLAIAVGGRDKDIERMRHYFNDCPNMHFVGHRPQDVVAMYQVSADLLFFPMTRSNPIWWCSSPLKLFEYMAAGVPIVGSAIGAAAEVLNGDNALLFDPEQPDSLLACVGEYLQRPAIGQDKAARALTAVQAYRWTARARAIASFAGWLQP